MTNPKKFAEWYKKNAKALNARRRKRYDADPEYRKRQLVSTRKWRVQRKRWLKEHPPKPKPKTRFTISEAAEQIGCDIQTIRLLERKGLLPSATDGHKHRMYTKKQISLMRPLIRYRCEYHYRVPGYDKVVKTLSKKIFKGW
jgi:hypothetical protein